MELRDLGWNDHFDQHFETYRNSGLSAARVSAEHRERFELLSQQGERIGQVSGRFHYTALSRADYPCVGDWVAVSMSETDDTAIIQAVLPRQSSFSRKAVLAGGPKYGDGKTEEQVLAANIDTVFLVTGLDGNYNLRRIERYLAVAWDSGATPVIVLNKVDLCDNPERIRAEVQASAGGQSVVFVSAAEGTGVGEVRRFIESGRTAAFLGSSGVGKSTLINRLIGMERQDTGGVRLDDSRGRHTTTRRELILLPGGGLVMDTPGLREIQLWGDESSLKKSFDDVEQLESRCRFNDCSHEAEPGCAVIAALESGRLERGRYENYLKMRREVRALEVRKDVRLKRETERKRDKGFRNYHKQRAYLKKKGLM